MPDSRNPEVSEAEEALARQLYEEFGRSPLAGARTWSQLRPGQQNAWRHNARKCLVDAAPILQREEHERIREALPDPAKLRLLADWFAANHPSDDDEVQRDLRRWADSIATLDSPTSTQPGPTSRVSGGEQ